MLAAKLPQMHPTIESHPRGRVLAVDDSPVMRVLVTASLEALGYSVEAVDSGHAALEASRLENFDAIILDVDMRIDHRHAHESRRSRRTYRF